MLLGRFYDLDFQMTAQPEVRHTIPYRVIAELVHLLYYVRGC